MKFPKIETTLKLADWAILFTIVGSSFIFLHSEISTNQASIHTLRVEMTDGFGQARLDLNNAVHEIKRAIVESKHQTELRLQNLEHRVAELERK